VIRYVQLVHFLYYYDIILSLCTMRRNRTEKSC